MEGITRNNMVFSMLMTQRAEILLDLLRKKDRFFVYLQSITKGQRSCLLAGSMMSAFTYRCFVQKDREVVLSG